MREFSILKKSKSLFVINKTGCSKKNNVKNLQILVNDIHIIYNSTFIYNM